MSKHQLRLALYGLLMGLMAVAAGCNPTTGRDYYANYYSEQVDTYPRSLLTYDTGLRMWKFNDPDFNLRVSLEEGKDYAFNIQLTNTSNGALVIDWNRFMYVDVNGDTHHVIHDGVSYLDPVAKQTPSVIPAGGVLNDLVQPARLVKEDGAIRLAPLTKDDTATWGDWPQDATLMMPIHTVDGEEVYRMQLDLSSGGPWMD